MAAWLPGPWVCLLLLQAAPAAAAEWQYAVIEEGVAGDYDVRADITSDGAWPNGGEARIAFDHADARNCYVAIVANGEVRLLKVQNGREQVSGRPAEMKQAGARRTVTIKRRADTITVICDGLVAVTACDAERPGSQVAVAAQPETLHVLEPLVQPVADFYFGDDFVREGGEAGEWEPLCGRWWVTGLRGEPVRPDLSANPFACLGSITPDTDYGLAVAGSPLNWFWDGYEVRAAVKAASRGAIGLAAYVQDADNFLAVRWIERSPREDGPQGRMQLLEVRDGKWRLLAQCDGGYVMDRWYELKLRVSDRRLEALVDGRPMLQARHNSFGCGRPGLYVADCKAAYFDDVVVESWHAFADDFGDPPQTWKLLAGKSEVKQGHLYLGGAANAPAATLIPDSTWQAWSLALDVKPKGPATVGLLLGYRSPRDYAALRWGNDGQLELVTVTDGRQHSLASTTTRRRTDEFHHIAASSLANRLAVTVDERLMLELALPQPLPGPLGLMAEGQEQACFDNVEASALAERVPEIEIAEQFSREDSMTGWTRNSNLWTLVEAEARFKYNTPVFGDIALVTPLSGLASQPAEPRPRVAAFFGDEGGRETAVTVQQDTDPTLLRGEVLQGGQKVAVNTMPVPEGNLQVRLGRRGRCVEARVNDQTIVIGYPPHPPDGRRLTLSDELGPDLERTVVFGPQLWDYTFSGAPTDFAAQLGVWEVTDRWPCYPGWSWFGCRKTDSPLVWSKRRFFGDQTFDIWCALVMDMDHEPGYTDPSDLNAIICGDGDQLCSGYGFIYAGDHNTNSVIMRGQERVVQNPNMKLDNPVSMNLEFQRHWFHLHIEKKGSKVSFSVDGQLVGEYDDPNPIEGGHVGVWSWNNGIVIARARMSAERAEL